MNAETWYMVAKRLHCKLTKKTNEVEQLKSDLATVTEALEVSKESVCILKEKLGIE